MARLTVLYNTCTCMWFTCAKHKGIFLITLRRWYNKGVLWHRPCSPGYRGSNLAATPGQWVLVAPFDGEDGGEDAGLGLETPLEGRGPVS